jgi:hypothetical protein
MWQWTKERIAIMLRTNKKNIPDEWPLRPTVNLWPPQRQRAVLWTLAQFTEYRSRQQRKLTTQDYFDFLRRAKWKLDGKRKHKKQTVGNYLRVLTEVL